MRLILSALILWATTWSIYSQEEKAEEKEKTAELKDDSESTLEDRIMLVLKYGTSTQVRDTIPRILKLDEDKQKLFIEEITKLISSRDILVRRKIAEMIGKLKWNDLDPKLADLLDEPEDEIFYAVAAALQKKKVPEALPVIKAEIEKADFTKASNRIPDLLRLYGEYEDTSLNEKLYETLNEEDTYKEFRYSILKYFAKCKPAYQPAIDYATEQLENEEESDLKLKTMAVYLLGLQKVESARTQLQDELKRIDAIVDIDEKRKYSQLRVNLIRSLTALEDENVISILLEMSRDDDENLRLKAVQQLAEIDFEKYRELLDYKAKYDPSPKVQKKAKSYFKDEEEEEETPEKELERNDEEPTNP